MDGKGTKSGPLVIPTAMTMYHYIQKISSYSLLNPGTTHPNSERVNSFADSPVPGLSA